VSATAVSAADSTKGASAQITVINHVLVSVQPASITLAPLAAQGFTASVLGTAIKTLSGKSRAPRVRLRVSAGRSMPMEPTPRQRPPIPDAIQVWAISSDDTSQSGIATCDFPRARILTLHPPACTPALPKASL